jgi:uncharacterized protein YxeA
MKKILVLLILVIVAVASFYVLSNAKQKVFLPKPEDKAGKAASPFMPEKIQGEKAAKGTEKLKVTGPVRVYDLDDSK